jgi:uncharacterized protein
MTAAPPAPGEGLFRWPARRPWTVLLVAFGLSILAAVGASRMQPSASLNVMLGADDGPGRALERVLAGFDAANELLVLVSVPPDAPVAGARARLVEFATRLTAAVEATPTVKDMCKRVSWRTDPQAGEFITAEVGPAGLYYLSHEQFEAFRRRLNIVAMRTQIARNEAAISAPGPGAGAIAKSLLRDPLRLREFLTERLTATGTPLRTLGDGDEFISSDGRSLLILMTGARPSTDLDFAQEYSAEVQRLVNAANIDGLEVELSGTYAIAAASATSIRSDMITSDLWSIVFMQVLFLAAYRNIFSFVLAIAPVAAAILMAFGLYIPFSPHLSPLSAVIGVAVAGQGIDYCIHYLSHYETRRAGGATAEESTAGTGRDIGPLVLAASGTAIIAFLAVLFSGVRALRDFAVLGALGLVFSLAAALVVLPAMLVGLERLRRRPLRGHGARFGFGPMVIAIGNWRRVFIAAGTLWLAAAGAAVLYPPAGVWFETDLTVMHPSPNRPLETQARIGTLFGAAGDSLIVHMTTRSDEGLVALAHEVDRRLASEQARSAGVVSVLGPATLLPDPAAVQRRAAEIRSIEADQVVADFFAALDESIFDAAAYKDYAGFLRELLFPRPMPDLATLRRYPSLAGAMLPTAPSPGQAPEAIALVWFSGTLDDSLTRDLAVSGLRSALAELDGVTVTGLGVIGHDLEAAIRRELPRTLAFSGIAVIAALLIYFRRVADAALALIPVAFGIATLLAFMRLSGGRFNMANLVAMPLLVGLAVDNGIFLVGLARSARRRGEGPAELASAFAAGGHAIFMVSATTILAFGSMVFTSVPAIGSLGRVFAVGTTASLCAAYFVLMPLLLERARPGATAARSGR